MNPDEAAQLAIPEDAVILMRTLYVQPSGWVRPGALPPVLTDEVVDWCRATLTAGTYRTEWVPGRFKPGSTLDQLLREGNVVTPGEPVGGLQMRIAVHIDVPLIRFTDKRDQVAFRLRWSDAL